MPTLLDSIAEAVRETIDPGIAETLPMLDKFFLNVFRTSQGVVRDNIGRDWKVKHVYCGSLSGSHAWIKADGPDVALDGSHGGDGFTMYGSGRVWQGIDEMAGPGIIQRVIKLVRGFGNFPIPFELLQMDKLDASVGNIVSELVRGAAKRKSLGDIHAFWKVDDQNSIGKYTSAASLTGTTTQTVTLLSGRIRSFFPGLLLDLYGDSGGKLDNTTQYNPTYPVAVTAVDYLAKTITIRNVSSQTSTTGTNTVHFVGRSPSGTTATNTPEGLLDWIKAGATDTIFDNAISLAQYPQFRSIVNLGNSGALMSDDLNQHIVGFDDAYGEELDTIVTTPGVITGYLQNLDSTSQLVRYQGQNQALAVKAGFQPFGYTYNGMTYNIQTSPNCFIGNVFVLKLRNKNFKKYIPPRLDKTGTRPGFSGECEFVAPLMGSNSIFMPLLSQSAVTNVLQAPYQNLCQFAPRDWKAIRIGTYDENTYNG